MKVCWPYNDIYTPLQDASESLMLTDFYNLSCMLPLPFYSYLLIDTYNQLLFHVNS